MSDRSGIAAILSLFSSVGTLLCCALPALLVSLGLGAVVAGTVSAVPQLVWLSMHKQAVFGVAASVLVVAGLLLRRGRFAPCPVDPAKASACRRLRRLSIGVYALAVVLYGVGAFMAFLAAG